MRLPSIASLSRRRPRDRRDQSREHPDLQSLIDEKVAPALEEVEQLRLDYLTRHYRRLAIGSGIAVLVGALSTVALFHFGPVPFFIGLLIVFYIAWLTLMWTDGIEREYADDAKERIIPIILKQFGVFEYRSKGRLPRELIARTGLRPAYPNSECFDIVTGAYKGILVTTFETGVGSTDRREVNGQTLGLIYIYLSLPYDLPTNLLLRYNRPTWTESSQPWQPIRLEDPVFEGQFEVFGQNQVAARKILTPAMMTRLLQVPKAIGGTALEASFLDNAVFLKIDHPDAGTYEAGALFELESVHVAVAQTGAVARIAGEFKAILDLIDLLQLERPHWR